MLMVSSFFESLLEQPGCTLLMESAWVTWCWVCQCFFFLFYQRKAAEGAVQRSAVTLRSTVMSLPRQIFICYPVMQRLVSEFWAWKIVSLLLSWNRNASTVQHHPSRLMSQTRHFTGWPVKLWPHINKYMSKFGNVSEQSFGKSLQIISSSWRGKTSEVFVWGISLIWKIITCHGNKEWR